MLTTVGEEGHPMTRWNAGKGTSGKREKAAAKPVRPAGADEAGLTQ